MQKSTWAQLRGQQDWCTVVLNTSLREHGEFTLLRLTLSSQVPTAELPSPMDTGRRPDLCCNPRATIRQCRVIVGVGD